MPDAVDRAFRRAIRRFVFPRLSETQHALSVAAVFLIAAVLAVTATLAEPHIRQLVQVHLWGVTCIGSEEKEHAKNWCDFAIISCQILIALMIGGIAITDQLVKATQVAVLSLETAGEHRLSRAQWRIARLIFGTYRDLRSIFRVRSIRQVPLAMGLIIRSFHRIQRMAGMTLPRFYAMAVGMRFGASFPGGLYGVLAFILFEVMMAAQVIKVYFDYAQVCTP